MANLLGMIAGTLTTISLVPQVVKTWRTRRADDVSMGMLLLFTVGVGCWEVYGWMIGAPPIIIANAVTIVLSMSLIVLKLRC